MSVKTLIERVLAAVMPLVLIAFFIPVQAQAATKVQGAIVPPPVIMDAGNDVDGDGINDVPVTSICTGNSGTLVTVCNNAASQGAACDPSSAAACSNSQASCVPNVNDGVAVGDTLTNPTHVIDAQKSKCAFKGTSFSAKVTFVDPTGTKDFSSIDTDQNIDGSKAAIGLCDSADGSQPVKGPCKKDTDCTKDSTVQGSRCLTGDEYWAQAIMVVGSNADNGAGGSGEVCANNGCIAYDGTGLCVVSTCLGGTRAGLPCTTNGLLLSGGFVPGCPSGVCQDAGIGAVDATQADADEASITVTVDPLVLQMIINCPFEIGLSFPFEVKKGKGKVKGDLDLAGLAVIPPTVPVEVKGCFIHDQAGDVGMVNAKGPLAHTVVLGVYMDGGDGTGGALAAGDHYPGSAFKNSCPNAPLAVSSIAGVLQVNDPVTPIIGVMGVTSNKIKCDEDFGGLSKKACKKAGELCCSGVCTVPVPPITTCTGL